MFKPLKILAVYLALSCPANAGADQTDNTSPPIVAFGVDQNGNIQLLTSDKSSVYAYVKTISPEALEQIRKACKLK